MAERTPASETSERVMLLLLLVPYLRERDTVPVTEIAARFDIGEPLVRSLVRFLGTAGIPGETGSYQHEDLFDIDWDALELRDEVRLIQTVAVDDAPRFSPTETAALIAALQSIMPVLPTDDVAVANSLIEKLTGLHSTAHQAFTADHAPEDPLVPMLASAVEHSGSVRIHYRDGSGDETVRVIDPIELREEAGAWYVRAYCRMKRAERTFRIAQILAATPHDAGSEIDGAGEAAVETADSSFDLIVRVETSHLREIASFQPTVVSDAGDGFTRVRIAAWHRATAAQLLRAAPGSITIESPAEARLAAIEWAREALAAYESGDHCDLTGIH